MRGNAGYPQRPKFSHSPSAPSNLKIGDYSLAGFDEGAGHRAHPCPDALMHALNSYERCNVEEKRSGTRNRGTKGGIKVM
jgi:hypothetical protein|mmetsp:Transcript_39350/g.65359  ORF Transcript_39350/g.65359 Transcript_39350/m.65359 type:complete len:80 (-) Transcript_39350:1227-1466(-)